ncbi:MAG: integration host factor subunit alpha [Alphaproteobacteria bacterium]|nr:integration host factor subunit alpha [Alphaproteobacteria bacterium]
MATITRNDLAVKLRDKFGFTTAQSGKLVDLIFDEICESLINGEEVKFAGFGTFKILDKSARVGRNPKTGEMAIVTARRVVAFRPCTEFRERVSRK